MDSRSEQPARHPADEPTAQLPVSADAATVAGDPSPTPPHAAEPPRQIGRYLVLQLIGAGGMGVVYAAYDPQLDRKVAIKRLRDESPQSQSRMLREALAMARLAHPNVVAVHGVDVDEHGVYIVMEFVRGVSLRAWLAEAPRSEAEILAAFMQAGHGLAAAHAAGLIHRDFKPDNVLVDRDGRVRVCDFGLARAPASDEFVATGESVRSAAQTRQSGLLDAPVTVVGTIVGTPAYMAPEQAAGVATDAQSDIYSFCLSLYEALHGRRPDGSGATGDEARKVPAWLRAALLRGLHRDPAERWPGVAALLDALASDPLAARRRRARTAAGVALVAGLATAAIVGGDALTATWARERAESLAAARLEVALADPAAFEAFLANDEHRGTASLARAYLLRGEQRAAAGDAPAAQDDFATAYLRATSPAQSEAALRALARGFRRTWSARGLGRTLDVLAATTPGDPELAALRAEHGLLAGDLVGAAAALALPEAHAAPLQPLRPVLAALARGAATDHVGNHPRLVEFAGAPAIQTFWRRRLDLFALAPDLPPIASFTAPVDIDFPLARAGWAVAAEADRLLVLDLRRPEPVRLDVPFVGDLYQVAEADIDADGTTDLLLGPGRGPRGFWVVHDVYGDPRPPRPAHLPTHLAGVDLEVTRTLDLDGDARPELLAGFGAWSAYDLRVFATGPAGLTLAARTTLGRPVGLGEVRLADGRTLLAVATDEAYANPILFPAAPHVAGPAAVHLLRRDRSLAPASTLPLPRRPDGAAFRLDDGLVVGDLDGDGREDMLLGASGLDTKIDLPVTFLFAQRDDGSFAAATLVGLRPRLLVQADDDPALEVLANDRDYRLWLLGAGDTALPRPHVPAPPHTPPPPELTDPLLARTWDRTEQLGALGLSADAARELELAARLAPEPARLRLLDRAADHAVLAGDDTLAIALDERLVADPRHRVAALARSAEALARLARFAEAGQRVQALAAEPQPLPAPAAATLRDLHDLTRLARPELHPALDFHRPLDPAWTVPMPESVRRDPRTGDLRLELIGDDRRALAIPLLWSGGPLAIAFELELESIEWGLELRVALVDDAGRTWISGGSGGSGGGGEVFQSLAADHERIRELPRPAAPRKIDVRLGLLPKTRQGVHVFEYDGRIDRHPFELPTAPLPGRYYLVLGTDGHGTAPLRLAGVVRDLEVHGALVDPQPADDARTPLARAARHLADGAPAEALAALADAAPAPQVPLLQALALADLGDLRGAREAFHAALATADPDVVLRVHHALRRRPAVALAVREALGPEFLTVAATVWTGYFRQHGTIAADRPLARAALAGLERVQPETPEQSRAYADLLTLRGILAARDGDTDRAVRDLEEGLRRGPSELPAVDATLVLTRLAAPDPARAVPLAEAALTRSAAPDAVRLRLRNDPALADLLADPRWSTLVADPHAPPRE